MAAVSEATRPSMSGPSMVTVVASCRAPLSTSTVKPSASPASWRSLSTDDCFVSTTKRLSSPKEQPVTTPTRLPNSPTRFAIALRRWNSVRFARGSPSDAAPRSSTPPKSTPAASEQTCPHAAAVSVESPKATPRVQSMALPAWIMTVLSMRPKPTIGTAQIMKWFCSCSRVGGVSGRPGSLKEFSARNDDELRRGLRGARAGGGARA
mmetsp:Transcript_508/g.1681  ORF Transcript_508/g.1681 Transcript_508/m.1681 type:complete len:208 (-) Transcript_508:166-789(-)